MLSLITLASFDGTDGAIAVGGLVMDAAGNSFGTTGQGGTSNAGTVFELAAGSGTITTLASFNGANGQDPNVGLIEDASGNLFGVTAGGGNASNDGTVFEVAAGSNAITTLALFSGTNGANPNGTLIEDGSGNLFGTTEYGGASNDGTVFEVAAGSHAITTLASFNGANGFEPYGSLVEDGSGNLFGAATDGGAYGDGDVFEVAAGSDAITTLASFSGANGQWPQGGLIMDGSGNLFGTTYTGGASSDGTVFKVAAVNHAITTLASFNGANGQSPLCRLVEDGSGDLFGAAIGGGASNDGTVFEVAAGSGAITALASFNGANGQSPEGDLVESGGNLYGTAGLGGADSDGTVFEYQVAAPATFTVTNTADSGVGSLRYEIGQANLAGGASTISFGSLFNTPQTITLTSGQITLGDTTGTETITGPTVGVTVSGDNASRAFFVDSGVTASISGLTITQGLISGNGGGLYNDGGAVTLTNCTVSGNSASGKGGGLFSTSGTTTLSDVTLSNNNAGYRGGGLAIQSGTATLTEVTISGNSASNGGGGLFNRGTTTLTNSTVSGNSAPTGAGVYTRAGGTVILTDATVSGNVAGIDGGGLDNNGGTLTLSYSTVSDNSAGSEGGGLYNSSGMATLTNCTVSGNNAVAGNGGGIDNSGTLTLTNSTITGDSANSLGGGLFNYPGPTTITGCTFSGDWAGGKGGGIENGPGVYPSIATMTVSGTTFSDDGAQDFGGGINNDGSITVNESTFDHDYTFDTGGGYSAGGPATIANCTFSNDTATSGGGAVNNNNQINPLLTIIGCTFFNDSTSGSGGAIINIATLTLTNCTLSGNSAADGGGVQQPEWDGDNRKHDRGGEHGDQQRNRRPRHICLSGPQPDRQD